MFKKSEKEVQLDAFASVEGLLDNAATRQYRDHGHWHNQFREQVVMRIDESIFSVLYTSKKGAPNSSIRTLIGMMILKESFGWSDSQLFEHCRFNLLLRSALGLFNINDPLPVESTYYLFRKRIYDFQKEQGADLMGQMFASITHGQVKEFDVNGRSIRMDSKLIGSNIAVFSRYEIIHLTLCRFLQSLDPSRISMLLPPDRELVKTLLDEESSKTVYRSTREELKSLLQPIGILIYRLLKQFGDLQTEPYQLLKRVFAEQFKVLEDNQIALLPKEEISSSSLQSPDDPDSGYRKKQDQSVKGYNVNITETCSKDQLNLITNVLVDKANTSDPSFVTPAIEGTMSVTGQMIETAFLDGGFQSPDNDEFCSAIDMVYTGLQGSQGKFDLELTSEGLMVTDTRTGERIKAEPVRKNKLSWEDRWKIKTANGNVTYFNHLAIRASNLRRQLKSRTIEELNQRNNVEATVFQFGYPLRHNKSKYRGLIKQKVWAYCRCLWINLVRITNFMKKTFQRTNFAINLSNLYLLCPKKLKLQTQEIHCQCRFGLIELYSIIFIMNLCVFLNH